jgi:LPXTG-motif cell wall-anchored protein
MKWILNTLAALLILVGAVWMLQGFNILPGSFMTGQIQWAIAGIASALIGIGLLIYTRRRKSS